MSETPKTREELIALVRDFSFAVVEATKSEGAATGKNQKETRAARKLLEAILPESSVTADEIRQVIYC